MAISLTEKEIRKQFNKRKGKTTEYEARYREGDKKALWEQIYTSALINTPLPEWARQAIFSNEDLLNTGDLSDFSDVFGKPKNKNRRKFEGRLTSQGRVALNLLIPHVKNGGARDAETLRELAKENALNASVMEETAKQNSSFLDTLKSTPENPAGVIPPLNHLIEMAFRNREFDLESVISANDEEESF